MLNNKNRKYTNTIAENKNIPSLKELFLILKTFIIVMFSWIFFRAENMQTAFSYIKKIFAFSLEVERLRIERYSIEIFPLIFLLIIIEWFGRHKDFPLFKDNKYQLKTIIIILLILVLGNFSDMNDFIYFQF